MKKLSKKSYKLPKSCDGVERTGEEWLYSPKVKDHFFNPRNILRPEEEKKYKADGVGYVGSPACGDVMKVLIQVDPKKDTITDCRWQTFGCGSAIASTSMMSQIVKGMKLDKALKLTPNDIIDALGGLPARKIHCSVLGDKALRQAINDYFRKSGQLARVEVGNYRVLDKVLKITDRDIEEAVLEGADTLEKVQAKTKVGTGDPGSLPEVEKLVSFYVQKYYG
ncbi:MAG: iron-sulfur cluster assembly scaffold protein [Patescibacteria group bacterium]|nr:iron-sulfur cluster assembly scaffold protein [Patescibacteria group bacterium]MDD5490425.1 iron-sulfur cluster assembly scaffold protein [Patescibacteria group bacterium]